MAAQILQIVQILVGILTIISISVPVFSKNIRGRLFKSKNRDETDKCLLRNEIKKFYHENKESKKMSEDDYTNIEYMYKQYKNLGGNSFVDKLWNEMNTWEIE